MRSSPIAMPPWAARRSEALKQEAEPQLAIRPALLLATSRAETA
jgi:hypothetical protein